MDERERRARIVAVAFRALSETSRDRDVVARTAWDALREIEKLARREEEGDPRTTEPDVTGQGTDARG